MDLLDEIKAKEAVARMTISPEDDFNEPGEPPPKKTIASPQISSNRPMTRLLSKSN